MSGRKSPQKRPIWRCAGNGRFARAQTDDPPPSHRTGLRRGAGNGNLRCRDRDAFNASVGGLLLLGVPNSPLSPLLYNLAGTESRLLRFARVSKGGSIVIGRWYFLREAATLLEFARSTNDPELAASLVEKAVDLLAKIDESSAMPDPSPQAPDVERENWA
jgi:hypothetical protein